MSIRVLPATVAAGIAAGEVIERPASAVKELVENALDAGARRVTVEVTRGGMERITVSDDGWGIPQDEVELAFSRHATSKLRSMDDLSHLDTMGFRGEALPSIAAVGRLRMVSRAAGSDAAYAVGLVNGAVTSRGQAGTAPGTTVTVEALFADVPARRKYLRSQAAETARVRQVITHLAMAWPGVQFVFAADNRLAFQTSGTGSLRDVLAVVYGTEVAQAMLEVESISAPYAIQGLVSPAAISRATRSGISLFVNNRWVQHRGLVVAVEDAYQGFLTQGHYPIAALLLDVSPAEVDANVHPTKREVRFLREGEVFSSVQRAVRETLFTASPLMDARGALGIGPPNLAGQAAVQAVLGPGGVPASAPARDPNLFAPLKKPFGNMAAELPVQGPERPAAPRATPASNSPFPGLRVLGQVANTFVVAEGPDGMYLIDQHAAHEQVLFDRLLLQWEYGEMEVQPLLDPLPVELTPDQMERAHDVLPLLGQLGFQIETFGQDTWLIRALPGVLSHSSISRFFHELLASQRDPSLANSPAHYAVAASVACHSAVRAGQTLETREIDALLEALSSARNPHHCPHGRPTIIRVSTTALEREFGRT